MYLAKSHYRILNYIIFNSFLLFCLISLRTGTMCRLIQFATHRAMHDSQFITHRLLTHSRSLELAYCLTCNSETNNLPDCLLKSLVIFLYYFFVVVVQRLLCELTWKKVNTFLRIIHFMIEKTRFMLLQVIIFPTVFYSFTI